MNILKKKMVECVKVALLSYTLVSAGFVFAQEKTEGDYIKDLNSDQDELVIIAAKKLAEDKSEKAIDPIITVLKEHSSVKVRIGVASALGLFEVKGRTTDALKDVVLEDESNDVVYAALLSIGNIKDFENPSMKEALDYCEKNKTDDPFIKDIVVRVRKFLEK